MTFWWTSQNTFLEWVSCAVQLKWHVGNISQFWWKCTKWWLEFPKSPSSSSGNLVQHFISLCKSPSSSSGNLVQHFISLCKMSRHCHHCRCQNRRISGRGSQTVRLKLMVTGDWGHDVYPGSVPLDGGNTLIPTWLIFMIWVLKELIYHEIREAKP